VFLVDIALPRDVEEGVGALENVYLYNIDDLQQVAAATDSNRQVSVDVARAMVMKQVDEFVSWHTAREVGPQIAESIHRFFEDANNRALVARLRAAGVTMVSDEKPPTIIADSPMAGKTFVLTGTLQAHTRDEATQLIEQRGGKISSGVSKKTSYVLAGEDPGFTRW
jgi:NAD-dependent DNA ligase